MTTKIPAELSSTPGIADSSNATAITIDSSERVGIGTTSPTSALQVVGDASVGSGFTQIRSGHPSFSITNGNTDTVYLSIAPHGGSYSTFMEILDDDTDVNSIKLKTSGSERMVVDSSGNLLFDSGFGSAGKAYGVRAWVNFDGTGTIDSSSIRASGNVSSISDNATGKYSVKLTTAMPDTNYAVGGSIANATIPSANRDRVFQAVAHATDEIRVNTYPATDMAHVLVIAFR